MEGFRNAFVELLRWKFRVHQDLELGVQDLGFGRHDVWADGLEFRPL